MYKNTQFRIINSKFIVFMYHLTHNKMCVVLLVSLVTTLFSFVNDLLKYVNV